MLQNIYNRSTGFKKKILYILNYHRVWFIKSSKKITCKRNKHVIMVIMLFCSLTKNQSLFLSKQRVFPTRPISQKVHDNQISVKGSFKCKSKQINAHRFVHSQKIKGQHKSWKGQVNKCYLMQICEVKSLGYVFWYY